MDVFARLIKLKPGSRSRVREWADTMNARRPEALETLRDERVELETWFSLSLESDDYLICYMRAESLASAQAVSASSSHPIDEIHQQFKVDTWVRGAGAVATLLLDLDARGA